MKYADMKTDGTEYEKDNSIYKKKPNGELYCEGLISFLNFESLRNIEFKEASWRPDINEDYFIVDIASFLGYSGLINSNKPRDKRLFKYDTVYKTKEEVIKARDRQIWWG